MEAIRIRIPELLGKDLQKLCKRQHRSTSDVVRDSLRRYIALEQMNLLRQKLRPFAEEAGCLTDDDVFKVVS